MEQMVSKSKFKPHSLEYFRRIEETGEPLIITDRGNPVLKIVPYRLADREDHLEFFRNTVLKYDRPTDPVAEDEWGIWK